MSRRTSEQPRREVRTEDHHARLSPALDGRPRRGSVQAALNSFEPDRGELDKVDGTGMTPTPHF